MNMKKYTLYLMLLMLLPFFGACKALKEGYGIDNPGQYSRVYLAAAYQGLQRFELEAPKTAEVKVYANYSGVLKLNADLSVGMAVDLSRVARYNSENGTSFKPIPTDCFRLTDNVSVIPAGTTISAAPVVVSIITTAFQDDQTYLMPVRLTTVSDASISINPALETLYFGISCKAGALYVTTSPLNDYSLSGTENW